MVNIGIFVRQSATLSFVAVERTVNTSYMMQTQSEYDLYRLYVCLFTCMFLFVHVLLGKNVLAKNQLCKLSDLKRWERSNGHISTLVMWVLYCWSPGKLKTGCTCADLSRGPCYPLQRIGSLLKVFVNMVPDLLKWQCVVSCWYESVHT